MLAALPPWPRAGKAMGELAGAKPALQPPARRNRGERRNHEGPLRRRWVRDGEGARSPPATAPGDDVEVEHAVAPAAAGAAAEVALDPLERLQHGGREQAALDQRHRIGKLTTGPAMRRVDQDRRSVEQSKVAIEAGDRGFDDPWWRAISPVGAVRADRDRVEVRCLVQGRAPR